MNDAKKRKEVVKEQRCALESSDVIGPSVSRDERALDDLLASVMPGIRHTLDAAGHNGVAPDQVAVLVERTTDGNVTVVIGLRDDFVEGYVASYGDEPAWNGLVLSRLKSDPRLFAIVAVHEEVDDVKGIRILDDKRLAIQPDRETTAIFEIDPKVIGTQRIATVLAPVGEAS